jgi:excisionase family DNA binding protein
MGLGLRVSQVARKLDTSPDTVRRLFDRGILRGERTGPGQYRSVSPESIREFQAELSVSEAAELLGLCSKTIRKYVDGGLLEGTRTPGGHRRVLRSSVEALREQEPA